MNLDLQVRFQLTDCDDDERALAAELIAQEARRFGVTVAERFEREGLEVAIEGLDEVPSAATARVQGRNV